MNSEQGARANATPRAVGFTAWLLHRLTPMPAERRTLAAIWLLITVLLIGVLDRVTGTRLSLVAVYLVPISLAVVWLGRGPGFVFGLAAVVARFTADALDGDASVHDTWLWWNSAASMVVYSVVVWTLDVLMSFYRQLELRVRERTAELEAETRRRQDVQRQLLAISASERSAMGRELHDQLGQHLVGTAMAAQVLAQRLHARDEAAGREARAIADLVEQGIAQTRQMAHGLLLTQIEPERLEAEFLELCAALRQLYPRVTCDCLIESPPRLRDAGAAAQVFRIGQEALRNALRHSGAKRVELRLTRWGDDLGLVVEDDGCGLPSGEVQSGGLGLSIMRHRAEHLGTTLEVRSTPGGGTRISVRVPG
jgi:signal transduction histidine kinase